MNDTYLVGAGLPVGAMQRSPEDPSYSLNDLKTWGDLLGIEGTDSGDAPRVTPTSALSIPAVWQAVSLISGDAAKLPFHPYRRLDGSDREVARDHPSFALVRRRPNNHQHAFFFWRRMYVHFCLWNNAYAFIDRNGMGDPIELIPLLPDRTCSAMVGEELWYLTEIGGRLHSLPGDDVLHIQGLGVQTQEGCEMTKAARDAWGVSLQTMRFLSKFFQKGAMPSGTLEFPADMPANVQKTVKQGFQKTYGGIDNVGKAVALMDGVKFHAATFAPMQSQLTEARGENRRDVAAYFNIPPHKVGDNERAAYNTLQEENQAYLDGALSHILATTSGESWLKLLSLREQMRDSHYFEHNTAALLGMDLLSRMQSYQLGINAGIYSPDECRARENLNKRPDGLGSNFVLPKNMQLATQADAGRMVMHLQRAHREAIADVLERMSGRVAAAIRKAVKQGKSVRQVLDDHRAVVTEALRPQARAAGVLAGLKAEEMEANLAGEFFGRLTNVIDVAERTEEAGRAGAIEMGLELMLETLPNDVAAMAA